MAAWISLDDERPEPNRRIRLKGFLLDQPEEQVESHDVYVDEDGLFPTSPRVQDTHWQYTSPEIPAASLQGEIR